ncbi:triose-phosphate isomerase [Rubeoparvulum massiliense]|uniref:triose-phosphate isomerase n=1 Tax=Rubeoparvulum massiliense TaxID=1631346 RepID=UPI0028FCAE6C|nr:triose-phosphate isomerase [Rubeoparvulum massiliense]
MRKPLLAGNWKMYKTNKEAVQFASQIAETLPVTSSVDLAICAPFTALPILGEPFHRIGISLGAQNMYDQEEGAYTGEISPLMLKDLGVTYVILGHSERRGYFAETDELVNRKVHTALHHQLRPIVCIGESETLYNQHETKPFVQHQVEVALASVKQEQLASITFAYEPIWAIGTGKSCNPQEANEVIGFIRQVVAELYDEGSAEEIRILYGGSVKPNNIAQYMAQPQIDGALVGGASLDPASFLALVEATGAGKGGEM